MGLLLMSLGGSALAQSDEIVFWESVKDSKDGSEFCAYLESYPNGKFKALARLRAKKLGGECASGKLSREEKKDPPGKATLTASQVRAAWDACGKSSSENAEQACKSLLQSGGLDDKERVEIYVRLSVTYYHFHKWDDTIAVLTSAIEIDPDHAGHYASRAYAYRSAKKFRAAVVDMRKAAELDPKRYADLAREWAAKFGDSPASDGEKNRVSREDTEKASKSGLTGEAGGRTAKLSREEMEKIHWLQQYKEWKLLGIAGNEFKGSAKQLCWDCASIRFACQTGFITNYEKELPKLKIAVVDWPTSTGAWAWISKKTESAFKIRPEYASQYLKKGWVDCVATGGGKLWYDEKTAADELGKLREHLRKARLASDTRYVLNPPSRSAVEAEVGNIDSAFKSLDPGKVLASLKTQNGYACSPDDIHIVLQSIPVCDGCSEQLHIIGKVGSLAGAPAGLKGYVVRVPPKYKGLLARMGFKGTSMAMEWRDVRNALCAENGLDYMALFSKI